MGREGGELLSLGKIGLRGYVFIVQAGRTLSLQSIP
jgi:hypothetical protein